MAPGNIVLSGYHGARALRHRHRLEDPAAEEITETTYGGSSVVVGDYEGFLHWFDAATGELQARIRAGGERITSAPLVVNETLYVVTDDGELYAFRDRTPKEKS